MPLRVGRQIPIGNGSSVALLGVRDMEQEMLERLGQESGQWVHLLAHIECREAPPSGDAARIVAHHAHAIWVLLCPNRFERPYTSLVYPPNGESWTRVMFRRAVESPLRDPQKYLHATAKMLEGIWEIVRYAEYGGADENKPLTFRTAMDCPIQPYRVRVTKLTPEEKIAFGECEEDVPLGFDSERAEMVASGILETCRSRGIWGLFDGDMSRASEFLRAKRRIGLEEFDAGLRFLLDNDYLAMDDGDSPFLIREKFVVQCWRASLRLP